MNKNPGFTLIELMITLIVAAILLAWGVPSFLRFMERTTLTSETNTWVGVINHARNEAITRGERVTVCRSLNPDACQGDADCDCGVTEAPGSPPNYHSGYLVFTSTGNPQAINFRPGPSPNFGNELIRTGRTQTDQVTIRGNGQADNAFSFMPDGSLDPNDVSAGGVTARHVICIADSADLGAAQNSESTPARAVVVSQTGRPRVAELGPTTCPGTAANALAE